MDKYAVHDENSSDARTASWTVMGSNVLAGRRDAGGMTTLADDFPWHRIRRLHRK